MRKKERAGEGDMIYGYGKLLLNNNGSNRAT
jgi:hypothetical protein